jgi:hypothetical protein
MRRASLILGLLWAASSAAQTAKYDHTGTMTFSQTIPVSGHVRRVSVNGEANCSVDLGPVARVDCLASGDESIKLPVDTWAVLDLGNGAKVQVSECTTRTPRRDLLDSLLSPCQTNSTNPLYLAGLKAASASAPVKKLGRDVWTVVVSYRVLRVKDGTEYVAVPNGSGESFYPVSR